MKMMSIFIGIEGRHHIDRVFTGRVRARIGEQADLDDRVYDRPDLQKHASRLQSVEAAFATWGIPVLTEDEIRTCLPNLKALFYAAGTVQDFARPFLNCGVRVVSAWAANAVPVAEYAASQIVLANKGFYQCMGRMKKDYPDARKYAESFPGNYSVSVGLLGAGMIGKLVIGLLKKCELNIEILVFDPFLSESDAQKLGVQKAGLAEIFARCQTVSNHLANNAQTVGMLNKTCFCLMLPNATFLNTGRGAQVVEADLAAALKAEPGRSAVLDVTWPEPPEEGSELYSLDNVFLTPHIAGSMSCEVERMGMFVADELERFCKGEPLKYEVHAEMLKTMA